ncbi:MAG: hypothetical protein Q4C55_02275 [Eubacterium sp.]|nr:hypothetical protein [Eubacterium sp.]
MRRADSLNKIYSDFYNNIIPERVPSSCYFTHYMIAEYAKISPIEMHSDYSILGDKAIEISKKLKTDSVPFFPISYMDPRPAKYYQILGARSFEMSETGFMQHPEVAGMMDEEYQELTNDPYAFLLEKVIPRQYKNLNLNDPVKLWRTIFMANEALKEDEASLMDPWMQLFMSGEYYEGPPLGSSSSTAAPADFIADQLRGFAGFSSDLRRHKKEIIDACEAILPYMFYRGLPRKPHPEGSILVPVHMPTYMRPKDFEEVWLPTFMKMVQQYAAVGARCWLGLGNDYTRYYDVLQDFPAGTIMYMEKGDPKEIKQKLGNKHIIAGLFPVDVVKHGTKQETIDKVKEHLDILAPGGGYIFDLDRPPLMLSDINLENYIAMLETLETYGKYENAGQSFGQTLNSEGYVLDETLIPRPKSKYSFDWNEHKKDNPTAPDSMKDKLETYDMMMVDSVFNLLV